MQLKHYLIRYGHRLLHDDSVITNKIKIFYSTFDLTCVQNIPSYIATLREIYGEDIYIIVGHDHSNFIVGENIQARIKKTCEHHKKETNKIVERKLDISWRSNNEQSD